MNPRYLGNLFKPVSSLWKETKTTSLQALDYQKAARTALFLSFLTPMWRISANFICDCSTDRTSIAIYLHQSNIKGNMKKPAKKKIWLLCITARLPATSKVKNSWFIHKKFTQASFSKHSDIIYPTFSSSNGVLGMVYYCFKDMMLWAPLTYKRKVNSLRTQMTKHSPPEEPADPSAWLTWQILPVSKLSSKCI